MIFSLSGSGFALEGAWARWFDLRPNQVNIGNTQTTP